MTVPSIDGSPRTQPDDAGFALAPGVTERLDLRILRSLRRIIRAVDLHSRQLAIQHNVTGPQLICLLQVVQDGSVTVTSLARAVHLSPSTVIGILDRLEAKELITRQRDALDRRKVLVAVTDEGLAITNCAPSPLQDTLAEALHILPEMEQETIAAALQRVVDLMEARHLDAAPMLETGPIQPAVETPDSKDEIRTLEARRRLAERNDG
jgi:DNA-binding MarR family transcriptional regulator